MCFVCAVMSLQDGCTQCIQVFSAALRNRNSVTALYKDIT